MCHDYSFKVYSEVSDSGRFTACLVTLYLCDGDGEEGLRVEINTGGSTVVCYLVLLVESPELGKTEI